MKIEKGSFEMMKQINQRIVLQQIRDFGPISRAEIAKRTELTPPTVSKVALELLDAGFILETEMGESSGGRRPILLSINSDGGFAVGLAISARDVEAMVVDLELNILGRKHITLQTQQSHEVCRLAARLIEELLGETEVPRERILGVGVALHGLVNHTDGISIFAPHLKWQNEPVRQILEEMLNLPVKVDNDVRLMALGEMWKGAARDSRNFAYINVDYGVGTGIVLDGKILRGVNHSAGEIGHMPAKVDGPVCSCGKQGCLEAMISLGAVQHLESDMIREIVGTYLGWGIAVLSNLLDVKKVILGGQVLELTEGMLPAVQAGFNREVLPWIGAVTEIIRGELGADARIMGAVALILAQFYEGGTLR